MLCFSGNRGNMLVQAGRLRRPKGVKRSCCVVGGRVSARQQHNNFSKRRSCGAAAACTRVLPHCLQGPFTRLRLVRFKGLTYYKDTRYSRKVTTQNQHKPEISAKWASTCWIPLQRI